MNYFVVPVFYALVAIATVWLALLWLARVTPTRRTRTVMVLMGVVTIWLLLVPIGGLPLWNRLFSFYPNPSITLLGLVCVALCQRLRGTPCFKPADWSAVWIFGATAGSALYLHPMIFGGLDLYYWGWGRDSAAWVLAALAVVVIGWGSRLGVLLLAALAGYAVNALESQNCWDYVMDPVFWLISLAVLGTRIFARTINAWRTAGDSSP